MTAKTAAVNAAAAAAATSPARNPVGYADDGSSDKATAAANIKGAVSSTSPIAAAARRPLTPLSGLRSTLALTLI